MSLTLARGSRVIEGPGGPLELLIDEPRNAAAPGNTHEAHAIAVVAHPHPQHGGTMHSSSSASPAGAPLPRARAIRDVTRRLFHHHRREASGAHSPDPDRPLTS